MEANSSGVRQKLSEQLKAEPIDEKSIAGLLSKIILLEGDIRKVTTINEFGVLAVNETHRVVPYFQCFLWRRTKFGLLEIVTVSGAARVDGDAPSITTVKNIIKLLSKQFEGKPLSPFEATAGKGWFLRRVG